MTHTFDHCRVANRLHNPHPTTQELVRRRKSGFAGQFIGGSGAVHAIRATPLNETDSRIFRIVDCIAKSLEGIGLDVTIQYLDHLRVAGPGGIVGFRVREMLRQQRTPGGRPLAGTFERTGQLEFEGAYKVKDKDSGKLEDKIADILTSLSFEYNKLTKNKSIAEASERQAALDHEILGAEEKKKRFEDEAWSRLLAASLKWKQLCHVHEFLALLDQLPPTDREFGGRISSEWLTWMRQRADDSNPLKGGLDGLLRELTK